MQQLLLHATNVISLNAITKFRASLNCHINEIKKYIDLSSFCFIIFTVALAINVEIHLFTAREKRKRKKKELNQNKSTSSN